MATITRSYRIRAYPNGAQCRFQGVGVAWTRGVLSLPKLGPLKLAESLPAVARPDMVTLSRDAAGCYHVSFCAEVTASPPPLTHRVVGVDLGLKHLATLSTGEKVSNPKRYHAHLRYLRQQQRCLARRQKGSQRREKQRLRVARAHARVKHERQDALHRLTTRLVREFDVIIIEDLNVKALARGRHARAIQDVAFSEVRRQLTYKCDWYEKILVGARRGSAKRTTESRLSRTVETQLVAQSSGINTSTEARQRSRGADAPLIQASCLLAFRHLY